MDGEFIEINGFCNVVCNLGALSFRVLSRFGCVLVVRHGI